MLAVLVPAARAQRPAAEAASAGAPGGPASAAVLRAVDSLFADYAAPGAPGASVVVIRRGRVVFTRAYGLADLEARTPAAPRTDYRLASLTKQFTAMAVMILAEQGRLNYDDLVARFLPSLPAYARDVTIRNLLNHTGGLWDYEDFVPDSQTYQVKDRDVLALIARADSLYFRPGSAYRYSNTGYALLALVVERVSGVQFARFLETRVFRPLGMRGSVAFEEGVSTVPNRAYGHSRDSTGWRRTDQSNTSAVLGDGGVYTSVNDMVRWSRALDGHRLVSAATQRLAWTDVTLADGRRSGYGFGWYVARTGDRFEVWHTGETRGFRNAIFKLPDEGLTVVVLTNRNDSPPIAIARRLAECFLR
jgi:CubicO group peptidase (beta-lactamase class C family)